jgi:hypothetical protein
MKKSYIIKSIFILLVLLYCFSSLLTGFTQSIFNRGDTTFLVGVQTEGYNSLTNNIWDPMRWDYQTGRIRDSLFMNGLTLFSGADSFYRGDLSVPIELYKDYVNLFQNTMEDSSFIGTYTRPPIQKLASGQRSTYQAEVNGFYGYSNNVQPTGQNFTDDPYGASGRKAVTGTHNTGYLVSGLIENWEQSDNAVYCGAGPRDDSTWFIKPRMRIDSTVAHGNPDLLVARIDIFSVNDTLIKSVDIKAGYFLDKNLFYNGQYIEEFYFQLGMPPDITVKGSIDSLNKGFYEALTLDSTFHFVESKMHVDYRIWWYGSCDLWVDYVRLDDIMAHELFKQLWDIRIQQETQEFGDNAYHFYLDEFRYNNLPCMKYVQNKIKSVRPYLSLIALNFSCVNVSLKNKLTDNIPFLDSLNPAFMMSDHYTLVTSGTNGNPGYRCWLPPNVEPVNKPNLSYLMGTYSQYTNTMQNVKLGSKSGNYDATINLYNLSFVAGMNRMIQDANARGKRHIPVIQAHSWMNEESGVIGDASLREPTVEEIRVLSNLALCYGAKGIMYFQYGSNLPYYPSANGTPFIYPAQEESQWVSLGLAYIDCQPPNCYAKLVHSNYYGQDKAYEMGRINQKLNVLGPILMTLNWQNAYSVHIEGADHYYILDMLSIDLNSTNPNPCYIDGQRIDCPSECYWEMGFFYPGYPATGDYSKFFMMVNRRCVPDSPEGTGDTRQLRIKFDAEQFPGFNYWKITDVYTNQSVTFDKNNQGEPGGMVHLGSLGIFEPGEAKLFHVAP